MSPRKSRIRPAAAATLWKYSKPQYLQSQRLPSRNTGPPAPQEGQKRKKPGFDTGI
jgi:hypothetical protein